MRAAADVWARRLGALLGIGLAAAVLASASVAPGSGRLGLDLTVAIAPTGEIGIDRAGPLVAVAGMEEGSGEASGAAGMRNQTGRRVPFRLRALPSTRDADRTVLVRVASGEQVLYQGTLGGLRRWTRAPLVLDPGEQRTLSLSARVAPGAGDRTAGRIVDVMLELRAGGRP